MIYRELFQEHPLAGGGAFDMQRLFGRLLDVALIALGAGAASLLFVIEPGHSIVEGAFVAFDMALAMLLLPAFGLYGSWRGRSKRRLAINIVFGWIVVQGCGLALMFALHRTGVLSRLWVVGWTVTTGVALVASRLVVHAVLGRLRRAGCNLRSVAVVGAGAHCNDVLAKIAAAPAAGFRMAGTFNTRPGIVADHAGAPAHTCLAAFAAWVRSEQIAEVWLALSMSEERMALRILDEFRGDLVNLRFIPDMSGLTMFDGELVDLMGAPAINLMPAPMSPRALAQKAVFDRLFAAVALLALAPLMMLIAVAVKATSKGPVLFTQRRKGADGRVFRIFKFRTMHVHAQQNGVVRQATRDDPRVTRVGAFLRRTSLDELPQFFNVLRGEMSVVGPRPHALEHDDQYRRIVDGYIHRYRIKPGITGWAQINGFRGETDRIEKMQGRVEHDLYYLRNWSFALDMRIVCATVFKGFIHCNAY